MHGILHNNNFSYRIFMVKVMHAWFCVFCTQLCIVIRDYIYMVMQGYNWLCMVMMGPWTIVHGPNRKFEYEKVQNFQNQRGPTHKTWCACISHHLLAYIF